MVAVQMLSNSFLSLSPAWLVPVIVASIGGGAVLSWLSAKRPNAKRIIVAATLALMLATNLVHLAHLERASSVERITKQPLIICWGDWSDWLDLWCWF